MKELLSVKTIKIILLSIFYGYLVGMIIAYVDLFGSSQNAPVLCAFGASLLTISNLKRKKLDSQFKSDK